MEMLPTAYEKEFMRMAMIKHEETFRQQVHELHRLYRTQKTLMSNIEKSSSKNEICFSQIYHQEAQNDHRSTHKTKLDLEQQPAEEDESGANNGVSPIINESEIELTLGPPSSINTSDSGITYSSSSTGSSHEGKQHTSETEQVKKGQEMEILRIIESSSGYQNGSNMREKKRQDYPPWLFHVVSLNMT